MKKTYEDYEYGETISTSDEEQEEFERQYREDWLFHDELYSEIDRKIDLVLERDASKNRKETTNAKV